VTKAGTFEFPNIVTAFNADNIYGDEQDKAFLKAVDFASTFILSLKKERDEVKKAKEIVANSPSLASEGLPDVLELTEFVRLWSSQVNGIETPWLEAVVWFDKDQKCWKAQAVPEAPGSFALNGKKFLQNKKMDFVHKSGFFAVAKDRDTMIDFLKKSRR
jgi:uncharacterized UPF0160 family protein